MINNDDVRNAQQLRRDWFVLLANLYMLIHRWGEHDKRANELLAVLKEWTSVPLVPPDIVDYRDLLRRYLDHVGQIEGTCFLQQYQRTALFSDEEWAELSRLARHARQPATPRRPPHAEETARLSDAEIQRILTDAHRTALTILSDHREESKG